MTKGYGVHYNLYYSLYCKIPGLEKSTLSKRDILVDGHCFPSRKGAKIANNTVMFLIR